MCLQEIDVVIKLSETTDGHLLITFGLGPFKKRLEFIGACINNSAINFSARGFCMFRCLHY